VYLEERQFKILTDHKPLTYMVQLKESRGRLARWRISLEKFDFEILHKAEKEITVADALLRAPLVDAIKLGEKQRMVKGGIDGNSEQ